MAPSSGFHTSISNPPYTGQGYAPNCSKQTKEAFRTEKMNIEMYRITSITWDSLKKCCFVLFSEREKGPNRGVNRRLEDAHSRVSS